MSVDRNFNITKLLTSKGLCTDNITQILNLTDNTMKKRIRKLEEQLYTPFYLIKQVNNIVKMLANHNAIFRIVRYVYKKNKLCFSFYFRNEMYASMRYGYAKIDETGYMQLSNNLQLSFQMPNNITNNLVFDYMDASKKWKRSPANYILYTIKKLIELGHTADELKPLYANIADSSESDSETSKSSDSNDSSETNSENDDESSSSSSDFEFRIKLVS